MPALDLAYDLVAASYDWAIQRLDSMESRIQALMVFSASFLLTGPAVVAIAADDVSFTSWWFYLALVTAIGNLATGAFFRIWGEVRLPKPRIESEWLNIGDDEFKWSTIYWANEHFSQNIRLINWKWKGVVLMTVAFLIETTFLTVWGLQQVA